ncbi:MAG: zinc ribbon domain-containing protein [Methylotenera sp.]
MPIYDYQCSSCGFKAEVMRKISAPNIEACPECAVETFSKQLSAPSFQLNGSGWYATDFKNGSKSATVKDSSKDSASKSETAVEKKSDAAPAACATGCGCH